MLLDNNTKTEPIFNIEQHTVKSIVEAISVFLYFSNRVLKLSTLKVIEERHSVSSICSKNIHTELNSILIPSVFALNDVHRALLNSKNN